MAGGAIKFRHLNRKSSHRQALLRNLVTSLFTHESIRTTWHKAKEAQRLAEKLITLGKKNTNASRRRAEQIFYEPHTHLPTLFTTLRTRYLTRPGGYTRVLRIEPLNKNHDQAPSAILELVDGPRDMRFAMTAKSMVRERKSEGGFRDVTLWNKNKVTRFREGGEEALEREIGRLERVEGERGEGGEVGYEQVGFGQGEREGWEKWEVVEGERRGVVKKRKEEEEKRRLGR